MDRTDDTDPKSFFFRVFRVIRGFLGIRGFSGRAIRGGYAG